MIINIIILMDYLKGIWLESLGKRKVDLKKIEDIFENQTQIMVKYTYWIYENLTNEKVN